MTQWVDFKTVREHLSFHDVLAHYGIDEHGNGAVWCQYLGKPDKAGGGEV